MKKMLLFVFFVLGVLCFGTFGVAFGQMMSVVGVAEGDVFNYGYTCYFSSNDPHAVTPASFSWINQTAYFMINVTGVSGSSVNFDTTLHGLNGSNSLGACSMNVGTGVASISGYGGPSDASNFYFMASNVGMMGRMFPSSGVSPTINDTFMMSYMGGSRLTNHFVTNATQGGMMVESDFYFDQATGMMVEWRQQTVQTNGNLQTNSTQLLKITASSVWVVPEFPTSSFVPIFIAGTTVTAFAVIVMGKRRASSRIAVRSACASKMLE